jgi:CRISPR-associated protein Csm3
MADRGKHRPLKGKIILFGVMVCDTGLHIGASGNNLDIGGIDSPVVRDPITREPYVPGSSLKGKMRSMLERKLNLPFDRHGGNGVYRHECIDRSCPVCRVFGATGGREGSDKNIPGRLIVRDMNMTRQSRELLEDIETGLQYTEWKFENSLDRVTAAANPRQLERVPRGTEFNFEIIYTVETEDNKEIKEDLNNIHFAGLSPHLPGCEWGCSPATTSNNLKAGSIKGYGSFLRSRARQGKQAPGTVLRGKTPELLPLLTSQTPPWYEIAATQAAHAPQPVFPKPGKYTLKPVTHAFLRFHQAIQARLGAKNRHTGMEKTRSATHPVQLNPGYPVINHRRGQFFLGIDYLPGING